MHFEENHHESCRCQCDFESQWELQLKYINAIKDNKAAMEMTALNSWPHFALYNKDATLWNIKKWSRYDGYMSIFWDMTNITAQRFSDASSREQHGVSIMARVVSKVECFVS